MASDINRVILIGRIVKDPELRYTQKESPVANFSIANNRSYTVSGEKKEFTSFFNCIAWGKLGEVIAQYCKKGQRIAIEGRLQQRSWDDQSGAKRYAVEVVVDNFQFLTSKQGQDEAVSDVQTPSQPNAQEQPFAGENPFNDDDVPF
jgi:single-strand DNA-binding protein